MLPFTFDCPGPECNAIPPHIAELATSNTSFLRSAPLQNSAFVRGRAAAPLRGSTLGSAR